MQSVSAISVYFKFICSRIIQEWEEKKPVLKDGSECNMPSHSQPLANFVANIHSQGLSAARTKICHFIRKTIRIRWRIPSQRPIRNFLCETQRLKFATSVPTHSRLGAIQDLLSTRFRRVFRPAMSLWLSLGPVFNPHELAFKNFSSPKRFPTCFGTVSEPFPNCFDFGAIVGSSGEIWGNSFFEARQNSHSHSHPYHCARGVSM